MVVMDVLAKSMYGFALLKFQLLVDKNQVRARQADTGGGGGKMGRYRKQEGPCCRSSTNFRYF